jgi:hypothetical protein
LTWNITEDINATIGSILKKLDYTLEFAEDRNKLIHKEFEKLDSLIVNYLSSEGFINKQVKSQKSFLSETEPLTKILSIFTDYLTFPKYNNQNDKDIDISKKLATVSYYKQKENEYYEMNYDDTSVKNIVRTDYDDRIKKKDINIRLMPKQSINDVDRKQFKELDEYMLFSEELDKILGFGKGITQQVRSSRQEKIEKKNGDKYLRMMKRIRVELNKELPKIKDSIKRTIYFKKLDNSSPVYNLDNDTGYFNEQGDYIEVSENKIDLNDPKHIFAILDNYGELKEDVHDRLDSELWLILNEFEALVESGCLEDYEKDILIHKIDKLTGDEICSLMNKKYGLDFSERNLSKTYNEIIPKKLASANEGIYEEWLYTYKVKGTYKNCVKCGETKLLKEKYFYKEPKGKDGYKNTCIKCHIFEKNGKN